MSAALHPSRMGLEPLPLEDWLKPQPGDAALLTQRTMLVAAHERDVIAELPAGAAAVEELARMLGARGFNLGAGDRLPAIARAVAEDLCILTRDGSDYLLTAGILCFPNRWKLREKMGGTVMGVHDPVPDYAAHLADGVDRYLDRLKPLRAYMRRNWGRSTSNALFVPDSTPPVNPRRDRDFFLRREDQSFLKLPETGAVIFSIRTTVIPWADAPADLQGDILAVVGDLSPAWLHYKSLKPGH